MKIGNKDKVRKLVIFSIVIAMCLSMLVFLPTTTATDHYVNPGDDIQAVINAASNYDTIYFAVGTYNPTATITINKPLTLLGPQSGVDPRPFVGSTRTPGDTLTEAIIDVLTRVDTTVRAELASNIVLTGGGSMIPGLTTRIETDLKAQIPHLTVKVYDLEHPLYSSWLGAVKM